MRMGVRNCFVSRRAGWMAGLAVATVLGQGMVSAQTTPAPASQEPAATAPTQDTTAPAQATATLSATPGQKTKKSHIAKDERVQQTKDTKADLRKRAKYNPLVGKDANLPDKQLYDKALDQEKRGHFDVARLDLQTLLNTYPDSQYLMRAKLAVADCWFKEGGSAALAQAEQEYGDFITFFPNTPEAAEAQMRMGDIYLKQMDVPDRDYAKAIKAEDQYRTMLKTYSDAPPAVLKEAQQKLRDVQEVLAQREYDLGAFYGSHNNYAAALARYQTVVDTYPLFSHMDDAFLGIGDAYEAEAGLIRAQPVCAPGLTVPCLTEGVKAKLEEGYDSKAAAAYREVVLNHAAAPHAEDAKERLAGMNLPIPAPTREQVAASEALEGSRAQYTMRKRLELLMVRKPDTVTAAQIGMPPLEDAAPTLAPAIVQQFQNDFKAAVDPAAAAAAANAATPAPVTSDAAGVTAPAAPVSTAPLTLSEVPAAGHTGGDTSTGAVSDANSDTSGGGVSVGGNGTGLGAEVLTPGTMTGTPISNRASDGNAATGKPDANYGIAVPARPNSTPLPVAEAPAAAPDAINEVAGKAQPATEVKDPNSKKKPKPEFDKNDESSSKHKKKKGLKKLDPL